MTARTLLAAAALFLPRAARADVVGPCPPMFDPSHSGCHFDPSRTEILVASGIAFVLIAVVVGVIVAAGGKRDRGDS